MANRSSAQTAPVRAVFFDIDGTLVDSNYLHVEAWAHAFADLDVPVDTWRLHRSIGMDSEKLLDALLPEQPSSSAADLAARATELHSSYYEDMVPRLRAFEGGRELVAALAERGVTVVLATSAPETELKHLRAVLDIEDDVAEVTSGDDVETAKPAPDIIAVALGKAGAAPSNTIMIGDAVWDVEAAVSAGVTCIGVLTGGVSRAELVDAGAIATYSDVAELLDQLEESPLARLWS
ncbi:HAD superfamily hydrolase (TIGR01509 family)/HAD superfamily hydrolase (TIGR01549 family) [Glaciihabitans tibetensis]|uniref:HAD superfamily hydrolase (TIGR01509 family)/HAD superfamily hydrolase (TIGR01549 family) n=1 Tax=Glaciihabitans tibetensis TaxID=1266600 RepID=A0A2T0VB94_9MICO|nr:HAD family hydrolase [Glaciihabitans tibetensis]PRY67465.1 HAD superfamily hydrolase (TIGR01509 family)/HAD superfamily hydrolase (TIGR01549 family) [Glaciihabitans tibetensis]